VKRTWIALALLTACDDELSYGRLLADGAVTATCEARIPRFAVADCTHALCSCGDYVSSGTTRIAGSVGVGGILTAGDVTVMGALTIGGDAPITGDLNVSGDLLEQGSLQGTHRVVVGGDARIGGDVRLDGLRVGGMLSLSPGSALEVPQPPPVTRADVLVPAPCDCTPKLDVAAQIEAARLSNDNASIALDPERGLRTFDTPRTLALSCGRFYVQQIYAASPLALDVHGKVGLFIDQRIVTEAAGSLTITLDPDAELELYLRLGVTAAGSITLTGGSTRIYVGGDDSFFFAAPTRLEATLYAPRTELVSQRRFELTGSALLQRAVSEAELVVTQACN
jgi:cytoskeletal protein CcmA (bactofilin family)